MDQVPPLCKSALDKLDRAKAHIDQINTEFPSWLRRAYAIRTEAHFQLGEVRRYVTQMEPLPPAWSIIVGDAIHDMRSALDHLVWGLTVHYQGREPLEPLPPNDSNCLWRKVAFPVRLTAPRSWPPVQLRGIDPALHQRFRDIQPFTARSEWKARRETLWVLEELWNRDKHRSVLGVGTPLAVRTTLAEEEFLLQREVGQTSQDFPDISVSDVEFFAGGEIEHGKETQAIRLAFDGDGIPEYWRLRSYLKQYAHLVGDIEFDKGPPAYGLSARRLLRQIHEDVSGIVGSFIGDFLPPRRITRSRSHCPPFRGVPPSKG